jgi:tetratricopeptide (TPR) repeat protein
MDVPTRVRPEFGEGGSCRPSFLSPIRWLGLLRRAFWPNSRSCILSRQVEAAMNQRVRPFSLAEGWSVQQDSPVQAELDDFALAEARLRAKRPLRHARLRQIASTLRVKPSEATEGDLRDYLAKCPQDPEAIWLLAQVILHGGRLREAAPLLVRCLEIAPDLAAARFSYAKLLFHFCQFPAVQTQLNYLLETDPANPIFLDLKADLLDAMGDVEGLLAIRRQLATEHPGRAESWIGYGNALKASGQQDQSIACYRKAIECRSSIGEAYWSLANLKTFRFSDEDIARMESILENDPGASPSDRIDLLFALGKAYEDRAQYERSWRNYAKANAAVRIHLQHDPDKTAARVAVDKALFTQEFFRSRREAGCQTNEPIFVVGRLRSGSTLVEQILCSHSCIEATGELTHIRAIVKRLEDIDAPAAGTTYPQILATLDSSVLNALGEEYLESTRVHRRLGRPFFVDKNPANYFQLGMILLVFPNAKIIDARRHPAASCLSIFKQNFRDTNRRLSELGRIYREYVELLAHFERVVPGRIHRVIYEDMVRDPETEIRKILDYLGLPFEEGCLRFHETARAVRTPSSEQVRRPISKEAVDHWRNYEPWLGPLIESLGSVFSCYPDVPQELQ